MKVKIVNRSKHPLPSYGTSLSAGIDLRANLDEAQIRPRSGLAILEEDEFRYNVR